jgi:hypothetical protein
MEDDMLQSYVYCFAKMKMVVGIRGSPSQDIFIEEHSRAVLIALDLSGVQDIHARMVLNREWQATYFHNYFTLSKDFSKAPVLLLYEASRLFNMLRQLANCSTSIAARWILEYLRIRQEMLNCMDLSLPCNVKFLSCNHEGTLLILDIVSLDECFRVESEVFQVSRRELDGDFYYISNYLIQDSCVSGAFN